MVESCVDKTLDKGRVTRGQGDAELVNSWRENADGNFVLLWTVLDDNVSSSRGIIREHFLFLWANMNDSSVRGDALGGLSLVSASFRHGGMYVASHTQGSSNLLNHKGVVRLGQQGCGCSDVVEGDDIGASQGVQLVVPGAASVLTEAGMLASM